MLDWLNIRVDGLSFFLGVAAGTLFWFLFSQFKKSLFPYLLSVTKRKFQEFRDRNFIGANIAIRQDVIRRAQKAHLSHQLFALDEVVIPPRLIAPPPLIDPSQDNDLESAFGSTFPFLPDWPEIASRYQNQFFSLEQLVEKGANVVVVGQPGTGKTVCLAHFASELARKDSTQNNSQAKVPIFLHIEDLLASPVPAPQEFIAGLSKMISPRLPIFVQSRVPAFLKIILAEEKAIFLIDGLDELPPDRLKDTVSYLRTLITEFPRLQIVATGSPGNLDGLLLLGFYPVAIANWDDHDRLRVLQNWEKSWQKYIVPEISRKSTVELLDPIFINNWIDPHQIHLTPFEWTLAVWAVYSGEGGKPAPIDALESYITHRIPEIEARKSLHQLAFELVKNGKSCFTQADINNSFSRLSIPMVQSSDPANISEKNNQNEIVPVEPNENTSISFKWFDSYIQSDLIVEHPAQSYRFSHINLLGFLASSQVSMPENQSWLSFSERWETRKLAAGYFFARNPDQFYIDKASLQGKPPFFHEPLSASRWLRWMPSGNAMRSRLMKRLVDGLMDESLFAATRLRFAAALIYSNDPSMAVLFRQLLSSPKTNIRAIACLALGILQDDKSIEQLARLLGDDEPAVRKNACYAFGAIEGQTSLDILAECLSAEDEILRLASAESLARDPKNGYKLLEAEANSENLLTRRSVVFGLSQIKEAWAIELLEKIAIQDGQWVVRNAASQALDSGQRPNPAIPHPLLPPSETPWLFAYASKLGQGIPQGDLAIDIFLHALQSGSVEEQIAALDHLRLLQDEKITSAIADKAINAAFPLNEAAQYALWIIDQISGER